jgi:hypothetical protein
LCENFEKKNYRPFTSILKSEGRKEGEDAKKERKKIKEEKTARDNTHTDT